MPSYLKLRAVETSRRRSSSVVRLGMCQGGSFTLCFPPASSDSIHGSFTCRGRSRCRCVGQLSTGVVSRCGVLLYGFDRCIGSYTPSSEEVHSVISIRSLVD